MLDLAKQLVNCNYDVKFYSYLPPNRLRSFGLQKENYVSLFFPMLPFLFLEKIFRKNNFFKRLSVKALDAITSLYIRKADMTIAMSGLFITSLKKAKKSSSKVIVERGSKHILEQKRILEEIPSLKATIPVPEFDVKRELDSYQLADYISIASEHVKVSFLKYGNFDKKLFLNPYGVDLNDFYKKESEKKYDIIMVGNWSYQKGVDLLWKACQDLGLSLLHVGSQGDLEFPDNELFTHHDSVDQRLLVNFYNNAKIMCLPSRQEGLAMVQAQAIACGLPIVCSMHTGGQDLKSILDNTLNIQVMEHYTVDDLKDKMNKIKNSQYVEYGNLDKLTWNAYGKRYDEFLKKII